VASVKGFAVARAALEGHDFAGDPDLQAKIAKAEQNLLKQGPYGKRAASDSATPPVRPPRARSYAFSPAVAPQPMMMAAHQMMAPPPMMGPPQMMGAPGMMPFQGPPGSWNTWVRPGAGGARPSRAKPTDTCKNCGGKGHWGNECPNPSSMDMQLMRPQ